MRFFALGIFLTSVLLFGCSKTPDTGFEGAIFFGEGDCLPVNGPGFDRDYEDYRGNVYFVPYSATQKTPFPTFEALKAEGIVGESKKGRVRIELEPGIYLIMLEDFFQFRDDKVIKIIEGEVLDDEETLKKYSRDASLLEVRPALVDFPKNSVDIKKKKNPNR
jgi:hypothetical protein